MLNTLREKMSQMNGDHMQKRAYLREYLQLLTLKILDEAGYFKKLAFVGGTALRVLYDLPRFSEDLDFCQIQHDVSYPHLETLLKNRMKQNNLRVEINMHTTKTVAVLLLKFVGLLFELKLAPMKDQKLLIKLEIDQNPPAGYKTQFTMVNKEFLIGIQHFDKPSLFAAKLHAILCRKYTKGRDFYDFIWYVSKQIAPNYLLLENAIKQTEKTEIKINAKTLKQLLQQRVNSVDFVKAKEDVLPFLENPNEVRFFNTDSFLNLVKQMKSS